MPVGKRQRDCADCGAPVGFLHRQPAAGAWRLAEDAAKAPCPGCGKQRILQDGTGRCVACSRACAGCGHPVRSKDTTLCRDCRRGVRQQAARQNCPKCGRPGLLREVTGWCGHCSRPRQGKQPPRACGGCGELRHHAALGLCSPCWQRHPDRPFVRGSNLAARLPQPPDWLGDFIAHLAARHRPARACTMITVLGGLLEDDYPTIRRPYWSVHAAPDGRSSSLARALEGFFTARGLALPTDQDERLAAGRRRRRIGAVPEPLRPAAEAFGTFMLRARERALRAGTRPRADETIETALATVRDLGRFMNGDLGKRDWALVDVHDA